MANAGRINVKNPLYESLFSLLKLQKTRKGQNEKSRLFQIIILEIINYMLTNKKENGIFEGLDFFTNNIEEMIAFVLTKCVWPELIEGEDWINTQQDNSDLIFKVLNEKEPPKKALLIILLYAIKKRNKQDVQKWNEKIFKRLQIEARKYPYTGFNGEVNWFSNLFLSFIRCLTYIDLYLYSEVLFEKYLIETQNDIPDTMINILFSWFRTQARYILKNIPEKISQINKRFEDDLLEKTRLYCEYWDKNKKNDFKALFHFLTLTTKNHLKEKILNEILLS